MLKHGVAASQQYGVNNQTDAFFISDNGQLNVAWVNGPGVWNGPIGLGPIGMFPPGAAVAVSPQYGVQNQTDVFAISTNGQLQVFWVVAGGTWNGPVGLGPTGLFPPGAPVAASPQYGLSEQTDVFAVAVNGQLQVAWVVGAGHWVGPIGIGQTGIFPAGAVVAASAQYGVANQTDVFAIGTNGQLHVMWVVGAGHWTGPVGLGTAGVFPPGAGVAASPQYGVPNQTDVFAVGNDGKLNVAWVVGGGAWSGPIGLGAPGVLAPGAAVAASPQYGVANQTDVFAIGANGQLTVSWVVGGGVWHGPVGLGPAGTFTAGGGVAASPQFGVTDQTDVFAMGVNGLLNVSWVLGGGNWAGPVGLTPPPFIQLATLRDDNGQFIRVDGARFSPNGGVDVKFLLTDLGDVNSHVNGDVPARANAGGAFTARVDVRQQITSAAVSAIDLASHRTAVAEIEAH